ncbi:MAG: TlpA family protein disulfide reductase [Anaerolineae bacterium]|nr:TlpA family protein disulfide reductase [Anaerolineae bacterium]
MKRKTKRSTRSHTTKTAKRKESSRSSSPRTIALGIAGIAALLIIIAIIDLWFHHKSATIAAHASTQTVTIARGAVVPGAGSPAVGHPAPDFEVIYPDGRHERLSDLKGRPVIINFWATWCPPCRAEMPELVQTYEDHKADQLVILGVDMQDPPQMVAAFVSQMGVSFPILIDSSGQIARAYQVRNLPSSIFVNREGIITARWIGLLRPEVLQKHLETILQ